MRLSIVMPIYNVSKWLGRCIASIRNQGLTAEDYEETSITIRNGLDQSAV